MRKTSDVRVFFALWPDDSVRLDIQKAALAINLPGAARRVPQYNLHMTLHFIGNVSLSQRDCLSEQAEQVRAAPFELSIDSTGYFQKPKVVWLGLTDPPQALFDLHHQLGQSLTRCQYHPETRSYSPHVTVMRKVPEVPAAGDFVPVRWPVRQFTMINSCATPHGVRYEVFKTYDLQ
ncbi:MAG: RNA 2',3'-cyclic phosphodiesterase [Pseudomonadota bacterium]